LKGVELYSDNNLVLRLKTGDQLAYEVLFYKYKNKLKGFIVNSTPPHIDPDEVLQQVFIKIWLQREKLDPEKSFLSFLFTIAKHEVIDQLRSAVNKKLYLLGDMLTDLNIPDHSGSDPQQEMEQKVDELIKKLPERRKQIFELSRFDGLSYKEIAKQLNISENTVDTQIRKALDFLRNEIKKLHFIIFLLINSKK